MSVRSLTYFVVQTEPKEFRLVFSFTTFYVFYIFQAKDEPVTSQPGASPSHKSPSESSPLAGATGPPSYDSVFPSKEAKVEAV